jgi:hypothetical protein
MTSLEPSTLTRPPLAIAGSVRASLVLVNYNGGGAVLACLASVQSTCGPEVEVIVVDNASTDGSADLIEAAFPQVTVVRCATNEGFGAGCNRGARAARGPYLVFLNPDTLAQPGWLEALLAPLESDAGAGLATSKVVLAQHPDRLNACGMSIHITGLTLVRGLNLPADSYSQTEEVDAVSGAAFAARRDLFEALGGFDEAFFLYMEDTDLSWRARLMGLACVYAPASVVAHDYALRFTPRKVFYQERNRYLMLLKTLRWPTLIVLLPAWLLAEVVTWGFVLWGDRKNLGNKLRAYGWIIEQWPVVMQKRALTQALRRASDRALLRRTTHRLDFEQAGDGAAASLARLVFDPLFFLLRLWALALVWW